MASLCGGGVGHWQACIAWWPWSAAQLLSMDSTCAMPREERENEGGRGSQRVSRCDLCCHCMSMLMKKEKEGEGDTHPACSCCCPLVACQPLRCAVLACHAHTLLLLLLTTTVQHHAHGACACMFVSVLSVQHTHDVRRKEGRGEWFVCVVVLCLCDWFLPLIHSPTPP